jgi:hypothetical protein
MYTQNKNSTEGTENSLATTSNANRQMINNAMKFNKVELRVAEKKIEYEVLINEFK